MGFYGIYPLGVTNIAIEHGYLQWIWPLIAWWFLYRYVKLPESIFICKYQDAVYQSLAMSTWIRPTALFRPFAAVSQQCHIMSPPTSPARSLILVSIEAECIGKQCKFRIITAASLNSLSHAACLPSRFCLLLLACLLLQLTWGSSTRIWRIAGVKM